MVILLTGRRGVKAEKKASRTKYSRQKNIKYWDWEREWRERLKKIFLGGRMRTVWIRGLIGLIVF
jgi:hypothetical protein